MTKPHIVILPDPAAVAEEAARRFVAAAAEAIAARGSFAVALSGGSTPKAMHERLAAEPFRRQVDWPKVEIFFGDERCVPPDHADSNYRMARETLLSRVPITESNVHRMRGEIDPNEAAIEYGRLLKSRFGDGGVDLLFLGMGDDGHTLSLFPGTAALEETHHRCVANWVAKLNTWRITISAPFANRSHAALALVTGAAKADRLREVMSVSEPRCLPIQLIEPAGGKVWLLDTAAAARLPRP